MRALAVTITLLFTRAVVASDAVTGSFPSQWHEVGFGPSDYVGPVTVIDVNDGSLRINGMPVGETALLNLMRQESLLVPAPALYIKATRSDYQALRSLAEKLAVGGACSRPCLFTVAGRKYSRQGVDAVP